MPIKISTSVLDNGIKETDLTLIKEWGDFLSVTDGGGTALSTSQLRKFFGELKRIQANFNNSSNEIILLDPKIAYAVARAKKLNYGKPVKINHFYEMMSPLIRYVREDSTRFKRFVQVCEAIVAYHKEN